MQIGNRKSLKAARLGTYIELNTTIRIYDWRQRDHYDGENVWMDAHTYAHTTTSATPLRSSRVYSPRYILLSGRQRGQRPLGSVRRCTGGPVDARTAVSSSISRKPSSDLSKILKVSANFADCRLVM